MTKRGVWITVGTAFGALMAIQLGNKGRDVMQSSNEQTSTSPADSGPTGFRWQLHSGTSQMDDSRRVELVSKALESIQLRFRSTTPQLVIRCAEHKTDVFVVTGGAAAVESRNLDHATVRLRIDTLPAMRENWGESTDNKALFAPNPIALARRLAKGRVLLFEFTPFNASPTSTRFDLTELSDLITEVSTACGWAL